MGSEHKTVGRFEIVGELGRGAMGVVYRAVDPHLGRQVAIKVLSPALASDEELVGRFTDEARNASRLLHQNIATVFEAGPSDAGWYVAFELVEGPTLRTMMDDGPLDLDRVADFVIQIGEGLNVAHKAGIVHRDLKPDNLIVTPDGIVKITDFGVAKNLGDPSRTQAGTILGTAYYMAPEQAKGIAIDVRADWFSLGVLAYEMITGHRPFEGYHEMAVLYAVVNEDPAPIESHRADVSPVLTQAVSRMLEKDPEARLCKVDDLKGLLVTGTRPLTADAAAIAGTTARDAPAVLAVLPLENKSPDPEYAFLAEGFAEDIGAALAQSKRFRVLGHEKVVAARSEGISPGEWGAALGARFVLHGSLFRAGDRLKVRLYLRNLSDDSLEWSQSFSGHKDEIFEIQDRVAGEVAAALGGESEQAVVAASAHAAPASTEAYEFLLRGRDYYRREGRDQLELSIEMFDKALELDPRYAAAMAAQADAYAQMYLMYYDRDRKWLKKAEFSAKQALMIDESLPEAHRALGRVMMEYGRNEDAIRELETAIRHKPDFHEAYRSLAWIYQGMQKYTDSIDWGEKSLRIKPMDRETYLLLGVNYLDLREWEKARHHFERAIELSPDYGRAYMHLGNVCQKTGDLTGALGHYRTALKYLTDVNAYIDLGWAQIMSEDLAGARDSFEQLIAAGSLEFLAFYHLGLIDVLEGHAEKALGRFESTVDICNRQLKQDEDNPYCMVILAQALARVGRADLARQTSQRAVALDKLNGAITFEAARVLALLNDAEGAVETLRKSLTQPMSPSLFEVRHDPHFTGLDLSDLTE